MGQRENIKRRGCPPSRFPSYWRFWPITPAHVRTQFQPMFDFGLAAIVASLFHTSSAPSPPALVSAPGDRAVIPTWDLHTTKNLTGDLKRWSRTGFDPSGWYGVGSKCTLIGGLIHADVYDDYDLFYSDNLAKVNNEQFTLPWLYRNEFSIDGPGAGQHYFLQTNGISSRADIWLNGKEVADSKTQVGAYGGKSYEITKMIKASNALVIQAYPSNPLVDLVIGWVDWNPLPADGGSGVWRDVNLKQTGPVAMDVPRITTDFKGDVANGSKKTVVTLSTNVTNLEYYQRTVTLNGTVTDPSGHTLSVSQTVTLKRRAHQDVSMQVTIHNAQIWWPRQWGAQPLYSAQVTARVRNAVSDVSQPQMFGIRSITQKMNDMNDTIFSVNGEAFQVVGAGYASDIFLRWDEVKFAIQMQYMVDMGMNTLRLEGKLEHPELYDITDRMGILVIAGWECCDKWEGWAYNTDIDSQVWVDDDYDTANTSIRHEISMMQSHPSVMSFIVGGDWWPDDRATAIYVDAFESWNWETTIFAVADKRGYPEQIGPSGMKMDGPYDWVPPNYWYAHNEKLGVAFGFASEISPGAGTPELGSLKKFLSPGDLDDLWQRSDMSYYHMSRGGSDFATRRIYDDALFNRYGNWTSLDDYLLKAQMADYEASRAMIEAYAAKWNAKRPATGVIYWMLSGAWPNLHWNLFDYYLHPAGSYYGAKTASRMEHVVYNYQDQSIILINRSLQGKGARTVETEIMDINGKLLGSEVINVETTPNTAREVRAQVAGFNNLEDVAFLRLVLRDANHTTLSRNVYWIFKTLDYPDFNDVHMWYDTPTTTFADLTPFMHMAPAAIATNMTRTASGYTIGLHNTAKVPAFFIRMNLVDQYQDDVTPVFWSDNYVTLWPGESIVLTLSFHEYGVPGAMVQLDGANVAKANITLVQPLRTGSRRPRGTTVAEPIDRSGTDS